MKYSHPREYREDLRSFVLADRSASLGPSERNWHTAGTEGSAPTVERAVRFVRWIADGMDGNRDQNAAILIEVQLRRMLDFPEQFYIRHFDAEILRVAREKAHTCAVGGSL